MDSTHSEKGDLVLARAALREQDYQAAADWFRRHLQRSPDDLEAELELGIAALLGGDERRFHAVYDDAASRLSSSAPAPGRIARLWELYQRLAAKVCRAAAVATMAALPLGTVACNTEEAVEPEAQSAEADLADPPEASPVETTPTPAVGPLLPPGTAPEGGPNPEQATNDGDAPAPAVADVDAAAAAVTSPPTPQPPTPQPGQINPPPRPPPRPAYAVVRPNPDTDARVRYRVARPRYMVPRPRYMVSPPQQPGPKPSGEKDRG